MFNAAKKQDLTLIINSSFRSYEDQEEIYNEFAEEVEDFEINDTIQDEVALFQTKSVMKRQK